MPTEDLKGLDMPFFDERLFGARKEPGMVAIEHEPGNSGDVMRLFFREGGKVVSRVEPFEAFIVAAESVAAACQNAGRVETLQGAGKLNRLLLFPCMRSCDEAREALVKQTGRTPTALDAPYLYIADPTHQHLLLTGRTHFLGLSFDDVRRMQLDIECITAPGYEFCNAARAEDRIVAVAMSDNTGWTQVLRGDRMEEAPLLRAMVETIAGRDPDVIEGHNIFNFDLPYIETRCRLHGVPLAIGRDGSEPTRRTSRFVAGDHTVAFERFCIYGRHIVDTLFMAHIYDVSHRDLNGFGLKELARHFGVAARDRTYVEGASISETFARDPETLMDYARDDVVETRAIAELLCPSSFIQAQMLPFTYQNVCVRGTATRIDALLVRDYLRSRRALPMPSAASPFEGGYTDVFVEGVVRNVHHCDVRSLYPSLMLTRGLGPANDELGVFLATLDTLRDFRLTAKGLMASAANPAQRRHYEALQSTFKILINSFYGYLGFAQGRFNDFAAAAEVTRQGRELLKSMIARLRELGATPIEIDTDGIYYVPPENVIAEPDGEAARRFEQTFASLLPAGIDVEFDGRYVAMLSYKMKNYALLDGHGEVVIKGAALRSRGVEPFLRECLEAIIVCRLKGEEQRLEALRTSFEKAISRHQLPMPKLCKTESLQDSIASYRSKTIAGKRPRAAVYELVMASDREYRTGDQVAFYVTGDKKQVPVHENAALLSAWDGVTRNENVPYYLAKLEALFKKFAPVPEKPAATQLELF